MPKQYVYDLEDIYNEDIVLARPGKGAEDLPVHGKARCLMMAGQLMLTDFMQPN